MEISLIINGITIEWFEIDLSKIKTVDERRYRVWQFCEYFHRAFYKDLMLSFDWQIVLTAKSKMI